jgi:hypothetical protein
MYAIAGVAVLVLAAAGIASFLLGRGGSDASAALEAAGCVRTTFPSQGRNHVTTLPKGFTYNSTPATSGPHQPQPLAPAVWNTYDQPIPEVKLVHNLEHGGVVVQYGSRISSATVDEIVSWYRKDPNGLVVAPLPPELEKRKPALANEIALTAWTHLQTCKRFSDGAFSNFVDLYRGQGPERFPVEALQPGNQ